MEAHSPFTRNETKNIFISFKLVVFDVEIVLSHVIFPRMGVGRWNERKTLSNVFLVGTITRFERVRK